VALTNVEKQRAFRERNRERVRAYDRARYASSQRRWHSHIRRVYGLDPATYETIRAQQGGKCAICRMPDERRLHVDHDHATGAVRGLLCAVCNRLLGQARDSVLTLERAADYLRRSMPSKRARSSKP
jgi:hypothetical protein